MDKEEVSFWNGVHKGLLLAEGAVSGIEEKGNPEAIQAIRRKISQVEAKQIEGIDFILGK